MIVLNVCLGVRVSKIKKKNNNNKETIICCDVSLTMVMRSPLTTNNSTSSVNKTLSVYGWVCVCLCLASFPLMFRLASKINIITKEKVKIIIFFAFRSSFAIFYFDDNFFFLLTMRWYGNLYGAYGIYAHNFHCALQTNNPNTHTATTGWCFFY